MSAFAIRAYQEADIPHMTAIWNDVIADGMAFPWTDELSEEEASEFFATQTYTAVAVERDTQAVVGLYILHPNDIGRKAHIANASYAVAKEARGCGIGRLLVQDSLDHLVPCGFRGMQFNAVVASNTRAIALYESLGFMRIGTIPGGFLSSADGGTYEDMHIYFYDALA